MADMYAQGSGDDTRPLDILVVDDEELILHLVAEILTHHGHMVRTTSGAVAAIDEMSKKQADLLMTDIRMPEMDGLALGKRIREMYPGTAIVLMTGYFSEYSQGSADEIGIEEIIRKPFKSADLMDVIGRVSKSGLS